MEMKDTENIKKNDKKADPVVHFDIPAEDRNRMAKFYTDAFGWQTQIDGDYVLVTTTSDVDKQGTPQKVGMINGGFYTKDDKMPAQYPTVVISVDNLKESIIEVTKAGGKVTGEPMEIKGVGKQVSFFDTEGNRINMMEHTKEMKEMEKRE